MTVELLDSKPSIQQTPYHVNQQNLTDELELAQLKLEQTSSLSPPFNQQILAYLDDSSKEIIKECSINLYLWEHNSLKSCLSKSGDQYIALIFDFTHIHRRKTMNIFSSNDLK